MSARSRAEWLIAFWSFFAAAFLAGSLQPFGSLLRQRRIDDQGPQNSSDAHLLSELGLSDGSRQIAECLRDVPLDARVALIYHEGSLDDLPAQIISRLAWPRPVIQGTSPRTRRSDEQKDPGVPDRPESPAADSRNSASCRALSVSASSTRTEHARRFHRTPARHRHDHFCRLRALRWLGDGAGISWLERVGLSWLLGTGLVSLALWLLGMVVRGPVLIGIVAAGAVAVLVTSRNARFVPTRREPLSLIDWVLVGVLLGQVIFLAWWTPHTVLGSDACSSGRRKRASLSKMAAHYPLHILAMPRAYGASHNIR
jgi:hypothetical protein